MRGSGSLHGRRDRDVRPNAIAALSIDWIPSESATHRPCGQNHLSLDRLCLVPIASLRLSRALALMREYWLLYDLIVLVLTNSHRIRTVIRFRGINARARDRGETQRRGTCRKDARRVRRIEWNAGGTRRTDDASCWLRTSPFPTGNTLFHFQPAGLGLTCVPATGPAPLVTPVR